MNGGRGGGLPNFGVLPPRILPLLPNLAMESHRLKISAWLKHHLLPTVCHRLVMDKVKIIDAGPEEF